MGRNRRESIVAEQCWPFDDSEHPSFPCVEVELRAPRTEHRAPRQGLRLKIDTGYSGHVMLSSELYEMGFQMSELPEEEFGRYRTASGLIEVRRARALVDIRRLGISMETIVETPRNIRFDRNLAGRSFLEHFILKLKGPLGEACMSADTRRLHS